MQRGRESQLRLSVHFDGNASGSRRGTPLQVEGNFATKTRLYIGSYRDSEAQVSVVTHLTSNVSSTSRQLGDLRQSISLQSLARMVTKLFPRRAI